MIVEKKEEFNDPDMLEVLKVGADDISSWDKVCSDKNITIFKKMTDNSPVLLLKAYTLIENVSP